MTLDTLIALLESLRARYPGAGTAYVHCPIDLEAVSYDQGEVQLGFAFLFEEEDDNDEPTRVH
jgi:hypothetical protein